MAIKGAQELVSVAGPRRPPLVGAVAGAARGMGVVVVVAAGTHPSRAQPSSFKPGAVAEGEETATWGQSPVVREALVGALRE